MKAGGLAAEEDYPYCVGKLGCLPCSAFPCDEKLCGRCLAPPMCNSEKYPCKDKYTKKAVKVTDWKALSSDETELA